jgi:CRISPR/Cas system Type II protein with McrA/HNH and RuvC-like nuclease domain
MMTKYRKTTTKSLAQHYYMAFIELLHEKSMAEFGGQGILTSGQMKLLSANIESRYPAAILQKIKPMSFSKASCKKRNTSEHAEHTSE